MQIVLKVNNNSDKPKIPYIVDSGYKKRGCYTRNLNYYKFEEQIIEVIKKVCKIYANKSMLEETYKKVTNKTIDLLSSIKKQIETIENKIIENNKIIDELYEDKLKGILTESDFIRISQKYIKEREGLNIKKSELMNNFQILQEQQLDKNNDEKMNSLINEFLEMKEIDKSYLFRLVDKIEIDKDKNVYIYFNFSKLNFMAENSDEFIKIEEFFGKNIDKRVDKLH